MKSVEIMLKIVQVKATWIVVFLILIGSQSCQNSTDSDKDTLFVQLPFESTGIDFENTIGYTKKFNIYTYRNYYNGGGVSLGDINNDSRC